MSKLLYHRMILLKRITETERKGKDMHTTHPSHFSPLIIQDHPYIGRREKKDIYIYIYSAVCDEIKTSLFSRGEGYMRKWYGWWKERVGGVSSRSRGAGITIILGGSGSSVSIKKSVRPSVHPSAGRYWGMQGSG